MPLPTLVYPFLLTSESNFSTKDRCQTHSRSHWCVGLVKRFCHEGLKRKAWWWCFAVGIDSDLLLRFPSFRWNNAGDMRLACNCVPLLSISPPVPAVLPEGPASRDKTSIHIRHIRHIPSKSVKSVLQSMLQSIQIPWPKIPPLQTPRSPCPNTVLYNLVYLSP